jgi:hypothetical protein
LTCGHAGQHKLVKHVAGVPHHAWHAVLQAVPGCCC